LNGLKIHNEKKQNNLYNEFIKTHPQKILPGGGKISSFNEKEFEEWKRQNKENKVSYENIRLT